MSGVVEQISNLFLIKVPKTLLGDLRIRPVKGSIAGQHYNGWLTEQGGDLCISLPVAWMDTHGVRAGDTVEVKATVKDIGLPQQKVPEQVSSRLEEMGISIDILTASERQQLFSSVAESRTEEIRAKRIEAIIQACVIKHSRLEKQKHQTQNS